MIALYKRLTRGCRSQNQFNAVHIALEVRLTPLEVMDLWSGLMQEPRPSWPARVRRKLLRRISKLPLIGKTARSSGLWAEKRMRAHSKAWISRLRHRIDFASEKRPAAFVRRRLRRGVSRFEGGGDRRGKTLLICFAGNGHRMMMPTSVFLQHIDIRRADVAYLRTERSQGFRTGVPGVTNDLESTIDALEDVLGIREYKRVATMGVSAGGLPAVLAGLRLGADAVLAAGPNNPNDKRWNEFTDGQGAAMLFRHFAGPSGRLPQVHLVHGANQRRDEAAAKVIASCIEVRSITRVQEAAHSCLFPLVQRRQFETLLESTVLT